MARVEEKMTVRKLIDKLLNYDKDLEVGYEAGTKHIDLLIGEDGDDPKSGAITIKKPQWG